MPGPEANIFASPTYSCERPLCTPAAGWRHAETGALTEVGDRGLYWSSSSYAAGDRNAGFLDLRPSLVNPQNNGWRAGGKSVRCVQHLRAAPIKKVRREHPAHLLMEKIY